MNKLFSIEEVRAEFTRIKNTGGMHPDRKAIHYGRLMSELEGLYRIPTIGSCEHVPEDVMRLYREISQAREI